MSDDRTLWEGLQKRVALLGFHARLTRVPPGVNDGETVAMLVPERPSVIMLDVPLRAAVTLLKKAKEHSELRLVPVIVLATDPDPALLRAAYANEANACVPRPDVLESAQIDLVLQYWLRLNTVPLAASH